MVFYFQELHCALANQMNHVPEEYATRVHIKETPPMAFRIINVLRFLDQLNCFFGLPVKTGRKKPVTWFYRFGK